MRFSTSLFLFTCVASVGAFGCGSSDDSSGSPVDSGSDTNVAVQDSGVRDTGTKPDSSSTDSGADTSTADAGTDASEDSGTATDSAIADSGDSGTAADSIAVDAATDSGSSADSGAPTDSASSDAADAAPAKVTLTISDYLGWCSVSVNGGASTSAPLPMSFTVGTVVHLSGDTIAPGVFVWDYWRGTDGDTTSAHDTSMTTTVTMTTDKTVQACCPDVPPPGESPTPCPPP